jgi:signal transduction histidine kinase
VTFTVEDDGPGIPATERDRVFERFVRLDDARARTDTDGSGLGLAIVAELVTAHDGTVAMTTATWAAPASRSHSRHSPDHRAARD